MNNEIIICIPTKRPPPVKTIESYPTEEFATIIVADPDVYHAHLAYRYDHYDFKISVIPGVKGLGAQCAACYRAAHTAGYPLFFKMDDDLPPKTFIESGGSYPGVDWVIAMARECLSVTRTSLAGFCNTSRRDWLGEGFTRTYGLIHGGGNLGISAEDPSPFMDERLVRGEDVYRTCAHRARDGAVGRVKFIGFDKSLSTAVAGHTSTEQDQAKLDASKDIILAKFPEMVTCTGTRTINNGKFVIPNWRMRRTKDSNRSVG